MNKHEFDVEQDEIVRMSAAQARQLEAVFEAAIAQIDKTLVMRAEFLTEDFGPDFGWCTAGFRLKMSRERTCDGDVWTGVFERHDQRLVLCGCFVNLE